MIRPRPILSLMEQSLALLDSVNRRFGRTPQPTAAQETGLRGERAAYFYLRRQGYLVVARRWTHVSTDGEVDLIAWDGETLCFVEVKTRDSRSAFAAEFRIDDDKQEALHRMARIYIRNLPWRRTGARDQQPKLTPRFDVVSVYLQPDGHTDIRLLRDAFR